MREICKCIWSATNKRQSGHSNLLLQRKSLKLIVYSAFIKSKNMNISMWIGRRNPVC